MNDCICANCKYFMPSMPNQGYCLKHSIDSYDFDYCGCWEVENE